MMKDVTMVGSFLHVFFFVICSIYVTTAGGYRGVGWLRLSCWLLALGELIRVLLQQHQIRVGCGHETLAQWLISKQLNSCNSTP